MFIQYNKLFVTQAADEIIVVIGLVLCHSVWVNMDQTKLFILNQ